MAVRSAGTVININGTAIGQVKSVKLPEQSVDMIDITPLDAANRYKRQLPGFIDPGEAQFTVFWDADAGQSSLVAGLTDGNAYSFSIIVTNGYQVSFSGYVSNMSSTIDVEGAVEADFTVKVDGAITVTQTSSAQLTNLTVTGTGITAISPVFTSGLYSYVASGFTGTTVTITPTLSTIASGKLYENGVYSRDFSSGTAMALTFTSASPASRRYTLIYNEAGKASVVYTVIVVK